MNGKRVPSIGSSNLIFASFSAEWSIWFARRTHVPKVAGSSPVSATYLSFNYLNFATTHPFQLPFPQPHTLFVLPTYPNFCLPSCLFLPLFSLFPLLFSLFFTIPLIYLTFLKTTKISTFLYFPLTHLPLHPTFYIQKNKLNKPYHPSFTPYQNPLFSHTFLLFLTLPSFPNYGIFSSFFFNYGIFSSFF